MGVYIAAYSVPMVKHENHCFQVTGKIYVCELTQFIQYNQSQFHKILIFPAFSDLFWYLLTQKKIVNRIIDSVFELFIVLLHK